MNIWFEDDVIRILRTVIAAKRRLTQDQIELLEAICIGFDVESEDVLLATPRIAFVYLEGDK